MKSVLKKSMISRRSFLKASALATVGTAMSMSWLPKAISQYVPFAMWKKRNGNGQTSNGYTIGQSLRFNSTNSAYLSRTLGTATNKKIMTISLWFKRSQLSYTQLFSASSSANAFIAIDDDAGTLFSYPHSLNIFFTPSGGGGSYLSTKQVFRDPSAWYHLVF